MDDVGFESLWKFLSINTAYPPGGEIVPGVPFDFVKEKIRLTHAYFMPEDLPAEEAKLLAWLHLQYTKTENPVLAIEAILVAHHCGYYPPLWALEKWLVPALQTFYGEKGTGKSIGDHLELKGGAGSFRDLAGEIQTRRLMVQIYINRKCFRVPVSKTAYALSASLKDKIWDGSGLNMGGVSESRLRVRYHSEKWEEFFEAEQVISVFTDEEKLSCLNIFGAKEKAKILKRQMAKPP